MGPPGVGGPNAVGKMQRRKRIFARLRDGASYDEIAAEEHRSATRIRQIVSEVLQNVDFH
jgi:hypothetical protein